MLVVFWVVPYKQERWSRYSHQRVRACLVEQLLLLERELLLHVPVTSPSRMRLRSPRPWAWRPPDQWWARHVVGHQPVEAQRLHYEPRAASTALWMTPSASSSQACVYKAVRSGSTWTWTAAPCLLGRLGAVLVGVGHSPLLRCHCQEQLWT